MQVHLRADFFFNKFCKCVFSFNFLNSFFSVAYFSVIIHHIIHIMHKICVDPVYVIGEASGQQEGTGV